MRHMKHTAKLGRNCGHRKALLVNLACSIIEHESVRTTLVRAKEVRILVENLITLAKKGGENYRRLVARKIKDNTPSDKAQTKKLVIDKLFNELAARYADRKGGYTRIYHTGHRIGDGAPSCMIQLIEGAAAPAAPATEEKKAE